MTLIHCKWLAPHNHLGAAGPIADCNLMLYVMAERFPPSRKYRDIFEHVQTIVSDSLQDGNHKHLAGAEILDHDTTERCRSIDEGLPDIVKVDYSHIISDMSNEKRRTRGCSLIDEKNPRTASPFDFGFGLLSDVILETDLVHKHFIFDSYNMTGSESFEGFETFTDSWDHFDNVQS